MKKLISLLLALSMLLPLASCAGTDPVDTGAGTDTEVGTADTSRETEAATEAETEKPLDEPLVLDNLHSVELDDSKKYQTIESFGASGAWWSQYVGDWDDLRLDGLEVREYIAQLLFDPTEGIGLNAYRYNIGGGSRRGKSDISDPWRRAYSFEKEPGVYDWTRDEAAVWFMNRSVELGVDEVIMFVNSPLERLTRSGKAHADPNSSNKSNLAKSNYDEFATYVLDVVEHFVNEGLPIKFVSPINEPQWDWTGGQEGCHYSNAEVVNLLKVFVEEIEKRPGLANVEISAPEGGEWKNATTEMCKMILSDEVLGEYFTSLDVHSYWSDANDKRNFAGYFNKKYPGLKYRCTEWCEMVNGKDTTIDSAINLAIEIHEDMTILDCVSWQYWIAVSCYDYRDGLIYVDNSSRKVTVPKRLWSMGNYSRYIDRGYVRVDCDLDLGETYVSAYEGTNENGEPEIVFVIVNNRKKDVNIDFSGVDASKYNRVSLNVTDKSYNLAETFYGEFTESTALTLPARSVSTVVISGVEQ